jgi:hypothetical protein
MVRPAAVQFFTCASCNEAGPETRDGEIACRVCGAPLASRDGEFVLKYFLLRKASRQQVWQKLQSDPRSESPADT